MKREASFDQLPRPVQVIVIMFLTLITLRQSFTPNDTAAAGQPGEFTTPREQLESNKPGNDPPRRGFPAPELDGSSEWFNTSAPVHLKDLRGKFVILDFWTYGCINCIHILPELKKLETAFPNNVVVIGIHSGKFFAEHDAQGIQQAILRYEIDHPVVNDADYKIWNSYGCHIWPTLLAIDPEGKLVASHTGEIDFATLGEFLRQNLPNYRAKGALDERPVHFQPERNLGAEMPLYYPGKVLADEASNRLFISDTGHNRIVITSLDGKILEIIGAGSVGNTDGDFTTAEFNHPQGLALYDDSLFIADTQNHLLRKVDLQNRRVVTIAGTGRQANPDLLMKEAAEAFAGPPLMTALNSPWAVVINADDLYIAMAGAHQIWRMPLDASSIGPYAGNGREDIVNGALLPRRPATVLMSSFAQPSGLTSDGKLLYSADCEGSSVRSMPFDALGMVSTIIGTAALDQSARLFTCGDIDGHPGKARLQHCMDVAYGNGQLYVADTYNHKIKVIDLKTRECTSLAGSGKPGYRDSSTGESAEFFEPGGISCAAHKLYVADTNNYGIRVIDLVEGGVSTLHFSRQ